jgi:hypothetical protein
VRRTTWLFDYPIHPRHAPPTMVVAVRIFPQSSTAAIGSSGSGSGASAPLRARIAEGPVTPPARRVARCHLTATGQGSNGNVHRRDRRAPPPPARSPPRRRRGHRPAPRQRGAQEGEESAESRRDLRLSAPQDLSSAGHVLPAHLSYLCFRGLCRCAARATGTPATRAASEAACGGSVMRSLATQPGFAVACRLDRRSSRLGGDAHVPARANL